MKRLMIMALMTGLIYFNQAQAQKRGQGPTGEKERMERAKTDLSLTDAQFKKWKEIHEKYGEKLKASRDNKDREEGQQLRDQFDTELIAILNESQKKKFSEMKSKRPGRKRGGK